MRDSRGLKSLDGKSMPLSVGAYGDPGSNLRLDSLDMSLTYGKCPGEAPQFQSDPLTLLRHSNTQLKYSCSYLLGENIQDKQ